MGIWSKIESLWWSIIIPLVIFVVFCAGLFIFVFTSVETPIRRIILDDNPVIEIWHESDINHPDAVHYRIIRGNKTVVPTTRIGLVDHHKSSYDIRIAFAEDRTLVCIYDSEYWDRGFLILYNTRTGEAWPGRGRHEQWRVYYNQLKSENPELPTVDF
jgi:hypothetical protein